MEARKEYLPKIADLLKRKQHEEAYIWLRSIVGQVNPAMAEKLFRAFQEWYLDQKLKESSKVSKSIQEFENVLKEAWSMLEENEALSLELEKIEGKKISPLEMDLLMEEIRYKLE